jgi:hypothetical protein
MAKPDAATVQALAALGVSGDDVAAKHELYLRQVAGAHAMLRDATARYWGLVRQMEKLVAGRRRRPCKATCPRKLRVADDDLLRGLDLAEVNLLNLEELCARYPWPHPFAIAWHREARDIARLRLRMRRAEAEWRRTWMIDLRVARSLVPRRVLTGSVAPPRRFRDHCRAGRPGHRRTSRATRAGPGDGSGSDEPPGPPSRRHLPDVDTRRNSP